LGVFDSKKGEKSIMDTRKGFAPRLRKAALFVAWVIACLQLPSSRPEFIWLALGGLIIYIGLQLASNSELLST
jgi:hypothetical protein